MTHGSWLAWVFFLPASCPSLRDLTVPDFIWRIWLTWKIWFKDEEKSD